MPSPLPKSNLTKQERGALKSLKQNKDIVKLPADKGKAVVVMDTDQYTEQCEQLLGDQTTCKNIATFNRTKNMNGKTQRKLKAIKKAGRLDQATYNKIYSTSDATPRFHATLKIHKDPLKM